MDLTIFPFVAMILGKLLPDDVITLMESRKWHQHDQDVINILCLGEISYLSPAWGFMSEYGNEAYLPEYLIAELKAAQNDPIILHYGGGRKPWTEKNLIFEAMEYWIAADKTPFFGTAYW